MDYFAIVKKAYHIALKNKFLWIFGLLAGGYGGFKGSSSFGTGSSNSSQSWEKAQSYFGINNADAFWDKFGTAILIILASLFVIGIIWAIVSIISQGALIGAGDKLGREEEANFKTGWKIGLRNFWKILVLGLICFLVILTLLFILIIPVIVFVMTKLIALAVIWGILFFILFLILCIIVSFTYPYALRIMILEEIGVIASIRKSFHFAYSHFANILVMYLLLWAISIGVGIAFFLAMIIVFAVLFLIGLGLWLASATVAMIYASIAILALIIIFAIFSGAYNTFSSLVLTFTYQKLKETRN